MKCRKCYATFLKVISSFIEFIHITHILQIALLSTCSGATADLLIRLPYIVFNLWCLVHINFIILLASLFKRPPWNSDSARVLRINWFNSLNASVWQEESHRAKMTDGYCKGLSRSITPAGAVRCDCCWQCCDTGKEPWFHTTSNVLGWGPQNSEWDVNKIVFVLLERPGVTLVAEEWQLPRLGIISRTEAET